MKKKTWLLTSISIVAIMVLGACGGGETPALPEEPAATEAPAGGEENAPEVEMQSSGQQGEGGGAYPAVAQPTEYVPPVAYPTPIEAENITWSEMLDFVQSNEVVQVLQTPTKMVVITLEDGTLYTTDEPEKDDIFELLDECGDPCNGIRRLTEW